MGKSRARKKRKPRLGLVQYTPARQPSGKNPEIYIDEEAGVVFARNLPGIVRMSEVISHLAQPVVARLARDQKTLEDAIRLTIFAWNATFRWNWWRHVVMMREAIRSFPDDVDAGYRMLLDIYEIVSEGKRRHYPDVKRRIVDVQFNSYVNREIHFDVIHESIDGSDDRLVQSFEMEALASRVGTR